MPTLVLSSLAPAFAHPRSSPPLIASGAEPFVSLRNTTRRRRTCMEAPAPSFLSAFFFPFLVFRPTEIPNDQFGKSRSAPFRALCLANKLKPALIWTISWENTADWTKFSHMNFGQGTFFQVNPPQLSLLHVAELRSSLRCIGAAAVSAECGNLSCGFLQACWGLRCKIVMDLNIPLQITA